MVERCRQGLCDEPYVRGHQCQRFFYLEAANYLVEEVMEDEGTEVALEEGPPDTPVVSLNAIAGMQPETMHLHGHWLLALHDSGSTDNFINVEVMRRIGLVTADSSMRVMVANGDRVA
jgi:hypothetical protein